MDCFEAGGHKNYTRSIRNCGSIGRCNGLKIHRKLRFCRLSNKPLISKWILWIWWQTIVISVLEELLNGSRCFLSKFSHQSTDFSPKTTELLSLTKYDEYARSSHKYVIEFVNMQDTSTLKNLKICLITFFNTWIPYFFPQMNGFFILPVSAQLKVLAPPWLINTLDTDLGLDDAVIPFGVVTFGAPTREQILLGKLIFVYSPSNFCRKDFYNASSSMNEYQSIIDINNSNSSTDIDCFRRNIYNSSSIPDHSHNNTRKNETDDSSNDEYIIQSNKINKICNNCTKSTVINLPINNNGKLVNITMETITEQNKKSHNNNSSLIDLNNTTIESNGNMQFAGFISKNNKSSVKNIFLIRSGGCSLMTKVWNAQQVGADAVVIVDANVSDIMHTDIRHKFVTDLENDVESHVKIPTVIVSNNDGEALIEAVERYNSYLLENSNAEYIPNTDSEYYIPSVNEIGITNSNQNNFNTFLNSDIDNLLHKNIKNWSITNEVMNITHHPGHKSRVELHEVYVQLYWETLQKNIVDVEFWADSALLESTSFLVQFANVANALKGHLRFFIHFFIFDLLKSIDNLCFNNNQKYCVQLPSAEKSFNELLSGSDIVEEDLRQLCLFKQTAKSVDNLEGSLYSKEFWDYIVKWGTECPLSKNKEQLGDKDQSEGIAHDGLHSLGRHCSERVLRELNTIDLGKINDCIFSTASAYPILDEQKANRVWCILAMRINGIWYNGPLEPGKVMGKICSAFYIPPPACFYQINHITNSNGNHAEVGNTWNSSRILNSILIFVFLLAVSICIMAYYQYNLRKSLKSDSHKDVMLDVKTQMEEYHMMPTDHMEISNIHTEARPLIPF